MNTFMARNTNRCNVKGFGIVRVMIVLSLFTTRTLERIRPRQFAGINGIINKVHCFDFVWDFCVSGFSGIFSFLATKIFSTRSFANNLSFKTLGVSFFSSLKNLGLRINLFTKFTNTSETVFCSRFFVKLRNGFNFLATTTLLCYSWFRHGFSPLKSCLEPLQDRFLYGSLYINSY